MMYLMKKIVTHDDEIILPKCMFAKCNYRVKNPNESPKTDEIDINIDKQVMKLLKAPNQKMAELEQRQDLLLKKLDTLYDRIISISSTCKAENKSKSLASNNTTSSVKLLPTKEEVVLAFSSDNLPWFLNLFLKELSQEFSLSWHIHSSVPNEKVQKIKSFIRSLKIIDNSSNNVKLRLIFKNVSVDSELKLSSLAAPILGNVNILRYLSYAYPNILPYNCQDFYVDVLLDLCHTLERTPEKNKEAVIKKIFSQQKEWIYGNNFSIVDLATYNVVKQWQNSGKYIPKVWFNKCEKLCL